MLRVLVIVAVLAALGLAAAALFVALSDRQNSEFEQITTDRVNLRLTQTNKARSSRGGTVVSTRQVDVDGNDEVMKQQHNSTAEIPFVGKLASSVGVSRLMFKNAAKEFLSIYIGRVPILENYSSYEAFVEAVEPINKSIKESVQIMSKYKHFMTTRVVGDVLRDLAQVKGDEDYTLKAVLTEEQAQLAREILYVAIKTYERGHPCYQDERGNPLVGNSIVDACRAGNDHTRWMIQNKFDLNRIGKNFTFPNAQADVHEITDETTDNASASTSSLLDTAGEDTSVQAFDLSDSSFHQTDTRYAINGDWQGDAFLPEERGEWIQLDLGKNRANFAVTGLELRLKQGYGNPNNVKLFGSLDNVIWTELGSFTCAKYAEASATQSFSFRPFTTVRYLRFLATNVYPGGVNDDRYLTLAINHISYTGYPAERPPYDYGCFMNHDVCPETQICVEGKGVNDAAICYDIPEPQVTRYDHNSESHLIYSQFVPADRPFVTRPDRETRLYKHDNLYLSVFEGSDNGVFQSMGDHYTYEKVPRYVYSLDPVEFGKEPSRLLFNRLSHSATINVQETDVGLDYSGVPLVDGADLNIAQELKNAKMKLVGLPPLSRVSFETLRVHNDMHTFRGGKPPYTYRVGGNTYGANNDLLLSNDQGQVTTIYITIEDASEEQQKQTIQLILECNFRLKPVEFVQAKNKGSNIAGVGYSDDNLLVAEDGSQNVFVYGEDTYGYKSDMFLLEGKIPDYIGTENGDYSYEYTSPYRIVAMCSDGNDFAVVFQAAPSVHVVRVYASDFSVVWEWANAVEKVSEITANDPGMIQRVEMANRNLICLYDSRRRSYVLSRTAENTTELTSFDSVVVLTNEAYDVLINANEVNFAVYNKTGQKIAFHKEGAVSVYSTETETTTDVGGLGEGNFLSMAFSHDDYLAISLGSRFMLYSPELNLVYTSPTFTYYAPKRLQFHPSKRWLVATSVDGAKVYDFESTITS